LWPTGSCRITNQGIKYIFEALETNFSIENLVLNFEQNVGCGPLEYICKALEKNIGLKALAISFAILNQSQTKLSVFNLLI